MHENAFKENSSDDIVISFADLCSMIEARMEKGENESSLEELTEEVRFPAFFFFSFRVIFVVCFELADQEKKKIFKSID